MDKPFVTVSVITYNSSKTIKDTLESVFNQTYPYLELTISDDCSSDETVSICRDWIARHKDRFKKTRLLTADNNTGVSANLNRAWLACETKWNKDIAGDDILFPNCIEDYIDFIEKVPDAIVVFSRLRRFETKLGRKRWLDDSWHNYGFFELSPEDQLLYLVFNSGHIPTCTAFYNMSELFERGLRHDERIPLLEDDPKWILFARRGIKFLFMDKETVGYRCSPASLANGISSPKYYRSRLLFYLYYYLDAIDNDEGTDRIYNLICDEASRCYKKTYDLAVGVKNSWDYRLGRFILYPLHLLKRFFLRA